MGVCCSTDQERPLVATVDHIVRAARTGDILLMQWEGSVSVGAWCNSTLDRTRFTHVALVLDSDAFDDTPCDGTHKSSSKMVFDCTTESYLDHHSAPPVLRDGCRLNDLRSYILSYPGHVAIRSLDLSPAERRDIEPRVRAAVRDMLHSPFDWSVINKMEAWCDALPCCVTGKLGDHHDAEFCSESVAHAFIHAGLLDPRTPAAEYTQGDFARLSVLDYRGKRITVGPCVFAKK